MSCSRVAQSLTQQQAGQCCAAQPDSEVVGASPRKELVGWWGCVLLWGARVVNKMLLCPKGKGVWLPQHSCAEALLGLQQHQCLPERRDVKAFNLVSLPCV